MRKQNCEMRPQNCKMSKQNCKMRRQYSEMRFLNSEMRLLDSEMRELSGKPLRGEPSPSAGGQHRMKPSGRKENTRIRARRIGRPSFKQVAVLADVIRLIVRQKATHIAFIVELPDANATETHFRSFPRRRPRPIGQPYPQA